MAYGVPEVDLFEGSDLNQGRNTERVTRAVQAVAREVSSRAADTVSRVMLFIQGRFDGGENMIWTCCES